LTLKPESDLGRPKLKPSRLLTLTQADNPLKAPEAAAGSGGDSAQQATPTRAKRSESKQGKLKR